MSRNSSKTKPKRSLGGFTLVELVVVIAVLAILAGVGAVAYNGYIEYAKKGVDRKTVGEIMHAIELADYADPGLFGEDGGAMVVLTKDGIKAAGGTVGSDIEGALNDTFGDLKSTTLSYDKWRTVDTSVFSHLGDTGTQVNAYIEKLKNEHVSAAFANDMEEYWEAFEALVNNPINIPGGSGDTSDIVKQVVDYYKDKGKFNADDVAKKWEEGNLIGVGGFGGMDLNLARNYAFISFLKQQNLSTNARTAVDDYLKNNPYDALTPVTDFKWCSDATVKTELQGYVTTYKDTQAEADARAYFGLMEAAAQVQSNLKDGYTDADFLAALDPYVPMVSNVLTGQTDLKAIQDLTKDIEGPAILVSLTKRSGVLRMTVSPEDADPRGGGHVEASSFEPSTSDVATKITVDLEKGTITTDKGTGNNIVMKAGNTSVLSAGGLKYSGYTIISATCNGSEKQYSSSSTTPVPVEVDGFTINLAGTDKAQTFTIGSKNASAGASTSVTIQFKLRSKSDSSEKTVSLSFTLYAV